MADLRIGVGRIWHESNSFCGLPTTLRSFLDDSSYGGVAVGADVLGRVDRRDEVTGIIEALGGGGGVEIVPLLNAGTLPSGLVAEDAVVFIEDALRRQLARSPRLDGVCFALHGAISGETIADLDGHFLQVLREELGEDVPIVCSLDCHAVVTRQMVELATALIGYRTDPHVDVVETGARAAGVLLDALRGRTRPTLRCRKIPVLLPCPDDGMRAGALKELFETFIGWDRIDGVIACSLCEAFPIQDVPEQGWAALAVTNDDEALADRLTRELAELVWQVRHRLVPAPMLGPAEAFRQAAAAPGHPIVITDRADNVGGGATGDTTTLLQAALAHRADVDGLILAHLPDPEAVATLTTGEPGAVVTIDVGGKRGRPFSGPVTITGRILCVSEGRINNDGGWGPEPTVDVGRVVCLGVDNVRLVLTERLIMGPQPSLFRKVGIEPFDAKIVTVKSGSGYKQTYGRVAKAILRADCPGAMSSNFNNFDFKHVPRPIFPLDGDFDWASDGSPAADAVGDAR